MKVFDSIFRKNNSFRSKQRFVILLASSIVLITSLLSSFVYNYYSFNRESRERLRALADIISSDIGASLAFGDENSIKKSLTALRADSAIKQIFILNEQYRICGYYHHKIDVVPDDLLQRFRTIRSEAGETIFDLSPVVERPVIMDGTHLGSILIEQDERIIIEKIITSAAISAVIFLCTLVFSYLLADRFQRVITEPVTAMVTTMQDVSSTKDYSKRLSASGTDEMDQLALNFNEMLSEIELRDKDLLVRQNQLHQLAEELTRLNVQHHQIVESNRRLEEISQSKSDFLANMSHELRTPLNAVVGFSEVLQDQLFGPINQKQQEYIHNILTSGRHLLSLISDILDLSKVESGKMELELSDFSLRETVDASLMMLKEKALKGGMSLGADFAPQADVQIFADQRKLKQILFNLLSNAVKFTQKDGSVKVSTLRYGDVIEITVADTGIGIKEEDIPKLFQAFTQLESVYTKQYEGTGLGLALTRQLVELHGGRIWVESTFGEGSRFSFTIPMLRRQDPV
jgi:signal transduction histidine kinase